MSAHPAAPSAPTTTMLWLALLAALPANQRQRCQPLPAGDREACLARMAGQGTTSGSAATGGISRDLVQRIPAATPPPSAASAASR